MAEPYHVTAETPPVGDVVYYDNKPRTAQFRDHIAFPEGTRWTRWFYKVTAHNNGGITATLVPLYSHKSKPVGYYYDDLGGLFFHKPTEWEEGSDG